MEKKYRESPRYYTLILCAGIGVAAYLALKYLLFLLLPLGGAWVLSCYLQKPFGFLRRLHLGKSLAALLLLGISLLLLVSVAGFAAVKLWQEAEGVGRGLSETVQGLISLLDAWISRWEEAMGIRGSLLRDKLPEMAMDVMEQIAGQLPSLLGRVVSAVPQFAVSIVVFFLSAFYFCRDFHRVNRRVLCVFDPAVSRWISEFKNQLLTTFSNYCKAYLFLLVLSFTQLYLGLTILRVNYAFSVALLIALIDVLPVLGMGVAVIPWALRCLLSGNYPLAAGLLVLFALMSAIRQVAEPKIVGDFIGLHPLVSLLCVFIGLRFLGVGGMFALPILVIVLKNMNAEGFLCHPGEKERENTPSL